MNDGNSADRERGFTLLEATIAIAILGFVFLTVSSAVVQTMHANATLVARAGLADDAQNVLADIRATTAYDADALAAITGRTYATTIVRDNRTLAISVAIARASASAPVIAEVTVTDPNGTSATERQQLYVEAPAPGSVIDEPSPGPSASASAP
jgi:prepilin-type N-terminal cleavage/methylation domain-containing protein